MRSRLLLAGLGLGLAALVGYFVLHRGTEPPLPEDAAQIAPSAEFANPEEAMAHYRAWLRREPDATEPRVRLAHVLMQQARATGRGGEYIPEAHRLLEEALERDPEHYYGRTLLASLYNTLHRFEDARDLSRELIAEFPQHAYTHGTLVDALVELGEYDEAVAASDRMLAIRPGLPSYSRASYLRELHGDGEGAIAAMRLAADAGAFGREDRAWALLQLGTLYLGQAKPDTAAFLFEGILEERPDFAPARAGLGHVALVKGDARTAIARLEEGRAAAPLEVFDELLVEAYTLAGDEAKARAAAERVLGALGDAREMGEIVDMEEADFLLDLGRERERALGMAAAQVRRRPGHLHANETYAWALHHNGRSAQALPYIQRAMRLNTGDAMVHHRAAQIYRAAGRPADAAQHARLALENNLHVESPTAAAEARALLAALERSGPPVAAVNAR